MSTTHIVIAEKEYAVVHRFTDARAIINYDGLFVFADMTGGSWDLSGVPARDDEKAVLRTFTAPMDGKVTVTSTIPDLPEGDGVPSDIKEEG